MGICVDVRLDEAEAVCVLSPDADGDSEPVELIEADVETEYDDVGEAETEADAEVENDSTLLTLAK